MIRLFNWFRRRSLERGFDRELEYHFDRRVADLSASGIPESEARRRVAVEFGLAQVREEVRDVWLTRWLRDFLYDLRFSARSFLRSPGFTAATLLSLALGIGATTAIYSLVDQVILHALPVREPERLVLVDWNGDDLITGAMGSENLMPYRICHDLQQQTRIFDGVLCRAEIQVYFTAPAIPSPSRPRPFPAATSPCSASAPRSAASSNPKTMPRPAPVRWWCSRMTSGRRSSAALPISWAARF